MASNLLKEIMTAAGNEHNPVAKAMIEKIESGYLKERGTKFRKKKSFSPSTLVYGSGECARRWFYSFNGADHEDDADAYAVANMSNGTLSHGRMQKAMLDSGFLLEDETKIINDSPPIFGYADGIAEFDGVRYAVEIKTAADAGFEYRKKSGKPAKYHLEQLIYYMKVLKMEKGLLIYENKNTYELLILFVDINDEYIAWVDQAFDWMGEVWAAYKADTIPARTYRSNSKVCKVCPVKQTCFEEDGGGVDIKPLKHLP